MSMYSDLKDFIEKMEQGYSQEMITLYVHLIEEEYEEWLEECFRVDKEYSAEAELKELCDILYVLIGYLVQISYGDNAKFDTVRVPGSFTQSMEELFTSMYSTNDHIVDYVEVTTAVSALMSYARTRGWDLVEAFNRVHKSNMSKLGDDGKPVRNVAGKVVKGPNYKKPNLKDLV